jgi:hypothetical protein
LWHVTPPGISSILAGDAAEVACFFGGSSLCFVFDPMHQNKVKEETIGLQP